MSSFGIGVKKYAQNTGLTLQKSVIAICADASKSIIEMTPVDTGRARGNWFASINSVDNSTSEDRKKSEALSVAKSESKKAYGQIFNLTNNLPYIHKLEYGGYPKDVKRGTYIFSTLDDNPIRYEVRTINGFSYQAPTGMVRITAEKISLAMKRI